MAASSCLPSQGTLSVFPFLVHDEFESACRAFLDRVRTAGGSIVQWSSIRLQSTGPVLKISQTLLSSAPGPSQHDASAAPLHSPGVYDPQLEACEEDLETLVRAANTYDNLQVDYDIILSDTYQVPVLYFVLRQADKLLGMDEVYRYLVPSQYRENIQGVGIMGGISFGYHPVSGTPSYFVHPCNTADAMKDTATGQGIGPEGYLIIWLGLIGNCLRLQLPSELFATEGNPQLESIRY
ncbi:hypothetical protein ASPCAL08184 [Aspergillus calidoustus]|uniref:Ubiquitin-like-conjugating enzyme ATG10 n=1 Tax=Aspergillus calidoustus TaxID=454130 RepID=A0A0U5GRH8_ASPCI|nr:hypothetical protein ASPCAL08184 [Aspergillus calidoustus]